ncbi:MAG: hypothetical protein IKR31_01815 [Prevotella sp.]|nr:hypothetical protein [Prevotella sp.]
MVVQVVEVVTYYHFHHLYISEASSLVFGNCVPLSGIPEAQERRSGSLGTTFQSPRNDVMRLFIAKT